MAGFGMRCWNMFEPESHARLNTSLFKTLISFTFFQIVLIVFKRSRFFNILDFRPARNTIYIKCNKKKSSAQTLLFTPDMRTNPVNVYPLPFRAPTLRVTNHRYQIMLGVRTAATVLPVAVAQSVRHSELVSSSGRSNFDFAQ